MVLLYGLGFLLKGDENLLENFEHECSHLTYVFNRTSLATILSIGRRVDE